MKSKAVSKYLSHQWTGEGFGLHSTLNDNFKTSSYHQVPDGLIRGGKEGPTKPFLNFGKLTQRG